MYLQGFGPGVEEMDGLLNDGKMCFIWDAVVELMAFESALSFSASQVHRMGQVFPQWLYLEGLGLGVEKVEGLLGDGILRRYHHYSQNSSLDPTPQPPHPKPYTLNSQP